VTDVLSALRGARENTRGDPVVVASIETLLEELGEGAAKAAAGRTIADLVAALPSRPVSS
jgi:hypothetical protein